MNIDDKLSEKEFADLYRLRSLDARTQLNKSQGEMVVQLQRALRQLPLEVVRNNISVAMRERGDLTHEEARVFVQMMSDIEWEFV